MEYRKRAREMRKYSLEFKTRVLKEYFDGIDGIRGLARKYGIDHQLIASWVKCSNDPEKNFRLGSRAKEVRAKLKDPPRFENHDKEVEFLRTENAYLREMLTLCGYQKSGRKKKDLKPSSDALSRDIK
jgi:transposase-like protein